MKKLVKLIYLIVLFAMIGACDNTENIDDNKNKDVSGGVKPELTTFKFASTNTDCGAYTQERTAAMIHINTEKCNNEIYRPTITLYFTMGKTITTGTYTISLNSQASEGTVYVTASDYMNPNLQPQVLWVAEEGSIEITTNEVDAAKFDVVFNSIKMHNTSFAVTTDIPEYDTLTGYIIGI